MKRTLTLFESVLAAMILGVIACLVIPSCRNSNHFPDPTKMVEAETPEPMVQPPAPPPVPASEFNKYTRTTTTTTKGGKSNEKAQNVGASVTGNGDSAAIKDAKITPGQASLNPAPNASGGGLSGSISAALSERSWIRWVVGIIGALFILAGCAALYLRLPIKASIGTIIGGNVLLASALYPEFALLILACGVGYTVVSLWLTGFDAARLLAAAKSIVNVNDIVRADPAVSEAFKDKKFEIHETLTPLAKKIVDAERIT